ncbi:MAG: Hsp20 family protein [Chloroflexota bacterium]|nr:Hsp20 family protein [Chloroflexota bacterium]
MKLRYQRVSYISTVAAGRQLERMLDYLMDASRNTALNAAGEWRPPVDVFQMDDELTVLVELAGMVEDDIEVVLFDDVLVVKGERKPALDPERELTYYEAGVRYGQFRVEVFLRSQIEVELIEASYQNGFLRIKLPNQANMRGTTVALDSVHE